MSAVSATKRKRFLVLRTPPWRRYSKASSTVPEGTVESAASSASGSASPPKASRGTLEFSLKERWWVAERGRVGAPDLWEALGQAFGGPGGGQDLRICGGKEQKPTGFLCALRSRPIGHQSLLLCPSPPRTVNASGMDAGAPASSARDPSALANSPSTGF